MIELQKKPRFSKHQGRPSLYMTEEEKAKRFAILRRRASLVQRLKKYHMEENWNGMIRVHNLMEKLKEELKDLGGVPKSWEEE